MDEQDREYVRVRKTMLEWIRSTPYNKNKTLRLIIDGTSTEGGGFVLFPWGDEMDPSNGGVTVNANCSRFRDSQLRFIRIEAEAISLDFSISICSYWLDHCPQIELYTDCSGLLDILNKSLWDIENKRLQKILATAQNFYFIPHRYSHLANLPRPNIFDISIQSNSEQRIYSILVFSQQSGYEYTQYLYSIRSYLCTLSNRH